MMAFSTMMPSTRTSCCRRSISLWNTLRFSPKAIDRSTSRRRLLRNQRGFPVDGDRADELFAPGRQAIWHRRELEGVVELLAVVRGPPQQARNGRGLRLIGHVLID